MKKNGLLRFLAVVIAFVSLSIFDTITKINTCIGRVEELHARTQIQSYNGGSGGKSAIVSIGLDSITKARNW